MADQLKYNRDPDSTKTLLKAKELDLESGMLGKIFGAPTHSPGNIAGLLIFLLALTGVALLFFPTPMGARDYWTMATPIITLALGYLFGRN